MYAYTIATSYLPIRREVPGAAEWQRRGGAEAWW